MHTASATVEQPTQEFQSVEEAVNAIEKTVPATPPGSASIFGMTIPAGGAVTPMHLLQIALSRDGDVNLDRLERLMNMHLNWEAAEAKKAHVAAMARFKENPPTILKNRHAHFETQKGATDYAFADLGTVCDAIIEGLAREGISHCWETKQDPDGRIHVTCLLTHKQGHTERGASLYAMADPSGSKNSIQAIGSTVSYLERYTLLASTGMAAQMQDDDGHGAGAPPEAPSTAPRNGARPAVDMPVGKDEASAARSQTSSRPMLASQRKILRAKLTNASLTEDQILAKFGRTLDTDGWSFDDFNAVSAWIDGGGQ